MGLEIQNYDLVYIDKNFDSSSAEALNSFATNTNKLEKQDNDTLSSADKEQLYNQAAALAEALKASGQPLLAPGASAILYSWIEQISGTTTTAPLTATSTATIAQAAADGTLTAADVMLLLRMPNGPPTSTPSQWQQTISNPSAPAPQGATLSTGDDETISNLRSPQAATVYQELCTLANVTSTPTNQDLYNVAAMIAALNTAGTPPSLTAIASLYIGSNPATLTAIGTINTACTTLNSHLMADCRSTDPVVQQRAMALVGGGALTSSQYIDLSSLRSPDRQAVFLTLCSLNGIVNPATDPDAPALLAIAQTIANNNLQGIPSDIPALTSNFPRITTSLAPIQANYQADCSSANLLTRERAASVTVGPMLTSSDTMALQNLHSSDPNAVFNQLLALAGASAPNPGLYVMAQRIAAQNIHGGVAGIDAASPTSLLNTIYSLNPDQEALPTYTTLANNMALINVDLNHDTSSPNVETTKAAFQATIDMSTLDQPQQVVISNALSIMANAVGFIAKVRAVVAEADSNAASNAADAKLQMVNMQAAGATFVAQNTMQSVAQQMTQGISSQTTDQQLQALQAIQSAEAQSLAIMNAVFMGVAGVLLSAATLGVGTALTGPALVVAIVAASLSMAAAITDMVLQVVNAQTGFMNNLSQADQIGIMVSMAVFEMACGGVTGVLSGAAKAGERAAELAAEQATAGALKAGSKAAVDVASDAVSTAGDDATKAALLASEEGAKAGAAASRGAENIGEDATAYVSKSQRLLKRTLLRPLSKAFKKSAWNSPTKVISHTIGLPFKAITGTFEKVTEVAMAESAMRSAMKATIKRLAPKIAKQIAEHLGPDASIEAIQDTTREVVMSMTEALTSSLATKLGRAAAQDAAMEMAGMTATDVEDAVAAIMPRMDAELASEVAALEPAGAGAVGEGGGVMEDAEAAGTDLGRGAGPAAGRGGAAKGAAGEGEGAGEADGAGEAGGAGDGAPAGEAQGAKGGDAQGMTQAEAGKGAEGQPTEEAAPAEEHNIFDYEQLPTAEDEKAQMAAAAKADKGQAKSLKTEASDLAERLTSKQSQGTITQGLQAKIVDKLKQEVADLQKDVDAAKADAKAAESAKPPPTNLKQLQAQAQALEQNLNAAKAQLVKAEQRLTDSLGANVDIPKFLEAQKARVAQLTKEANNLTKQAAAAREAGDFTKAERLTQQAVQAQSRAAQAALDLRALERLAKYGDVNVASMARQEAQLNQALKQSLALAQKAKNLEKAIENAEQATLAEGAQLKKLAKDADAQMKKAQDLIDDIRNRRALSDADIRPDAQKQASDAAKAKEKGDEPIDDSGPSPQGFKARANAAAEKVRDFFNKPGLRQTKDFLVETAANPFTYTGALNLYSELSQSQANLAQAAALNQQAAWDQLNASLEYETATEQAVVDFIGQGEQGLDQISQEYQNDAQQLADTYQQLLSFFSKFMNDLSGIAMSLRQAEKKI